MEGGPHQLFYVGVLPELQSSFPTTLPGSTSSGRYFHPQRCQIPGSGPPIFPVIVSSPAISQGCKNE